MRRISSNAKIFSPLRFMCNVNPENGIFMPNEELVYTAYSGHDMDGIDFYVFISWIYLLFMCMGESPKVLSGWE